jgi:hypothetical protein
MVPTVPVHDRPAARSCACAASLLGVNEWLTEYKISLA